ncbi:MAG TPA: ABC transporter permease [Mesotoga infera]|nr:ABC transporter permease [Mesotoga infera]
MGAYFRRKIVIYLLTFIFAVTIDWMIPRFMPGNPIQNLLSRFSTRSDTTEVIARYLNEIYGLDRPPLQQYFAFWAGLFRGDLGVSIYVTGAPVARVIARALPFDLALLIPAIMLSYIAGNKFGAFAARKKRLDGIALPLWYVLTATPYMWLGILLAWFFGVALNILPIAGAYSFSMVPNLSWGFIWDFFKHWILPFSSLFIVQFGGWAIGMRNMIIYELEAEYCRYLESLGASRKLIRRYAYKNAVLPQITGLALQLGVIVAGALATEVVFSYPGIGHLLKEAILNQDYFLIQGCFLFIIIGVLLANIILDFAYILIDPRIRHSSVGETV